MIQSGPAPIGAAFLVLDTSGMIATRLSCGQGLTSADLFEVWGSLGAGAVGGEPNLVRLGTLRGSSGQDTVWPWFLRDWSTVIIRRASGVGIGPIEVQGPAWNRPPALVAPLPGAPGFTAPGNLAPAGQMPAISFDDGASSSAVARIYGTNDPTPRVPPSALGSTYLGELRGGGGAPILVQGFQFVIVQLITVGGATAIYAVDQCGGESPPAPPGTPWTLGGNVLAGASSFGSLSTEDIAFLANGVGVGTLYSSGAWEFNPPAGTDFVVSAGQDIAETFSNEFRLVQGATNRIRILPSGEIAIVSAGVGVLRAGDQLDLENANAAGFVNIGTNVTTYVSVGNNSGDTRIDLYCAAAGEIVLAQASIDRLRVYPTGDVYLTSDPARGLVLTGGNGADLQCGSVGGTISIGTSNGPTYVNVGSQVGDSSFEIDTGTGGAGINGTDVSAILALFSTTRGFLPPRMTGAQKAAIVGAATPGLMVFDTTINKLCVRGAIGWETITSV